MVGLFIWKTMTSGVERETMVERKDCKLLQGKTCVKRRIGYPFHVKVVIVYPLLVVYNINNNGKVTFMWSN